LEKPWKLRGLINGYHAPLNPLKIPMEQIIIKQWKLMVDTQWKTWKQPLKCNAYDNKLYTIFYYSYQDNDIINETKVLYIRPRVQVVYYKLGFPATRFLTLLIAKIWACELKRQPVFRTFLMCWSPYWQNIQSINLVVSLTK
jgi:hypothetical protein